jgi:hypothetical protein
MDLRQVCWAQHAEGCGGDLSVRDGDVGLLACCQMNGACVASLLRSVVGGCLLVLRFAWFIDGAAIVRAAGRDGWCGGGAVVAAPSVWGDLD